MPARVVALVASSRLRLDVCFRAARSNLRPSELGPGTADHHRLLNTGVGAKWPDILALRLLVVR
jgi:hypothetical protein